MRFPFIAAACLTLLTACGGIRDDITGTPDPLGDFRLGHNITVAKDPQQGPFTRDVTNEEWETAIEAAIDDRLGRYDGDAWYHIAVGVQAYVVAKPGVPLVYSPKSVLMVEVTFFKDSTQSKLNEEPIKLTIFEPCCTPILGSGLTRSREEQIEGLSFNLARAIERQMRKHADWFGGVAEVLEEDPTIVEGLVLPPQPDTDAAVPDN